MRFSIIKPAGVGLFLLVIALGGCVTPNGSGGSDGPGPDDTAGPRFGSDAPKWVRDGRYSGYPSQQYITGLGYSPPELPEVDALDSAKSNAFTEISTQIETRIESEFTSIQRSVFHNDEVNETADFKSVAKQWTKEAFGGIEVVARYYDTETGTACIFAAMDRVKFGRRQIQEARNAHTGAKGHLKAFEEAGDDSATAMKSLVHALQAMDQVKRAHLKLIASGMTAEMGKEIQSLNDAALNSRLMREATLLRDSIRIVPLSGNEQKANLTGLLPEPIVVRVVHESDSGTRPLPAFPMAVTVTDPELATAVPQSPTTDRDGRFAFNLTGLKSTGSADNQITVSLDFDKVAKGSGLTPPSVEVTYYMPTKENTRIGVVIHEIIDGEDNPRSNMESRIEDALGDVGFDVIRIDSDTPVPELVKLPTAKLKAQFQKTCEYLIVGVNEAFTEGENEDGWHTFRCRLTLDAIELASGKTIPFEVPEGQATKGVSITRDKALRLSLDKAASVMVGDAKKKTKGLLIEKFISCFEKGEAWEK